MFNAMSFVMGFGVGCGAGLFVWLALRVKRPARRHVNHTTFKGATEDSTVYFGRDLDHPDDIERAASISYVPGGIAFGRQPR